MTGPDALHPPRSLLKPSIPARAPDSDKVGPLLIVGGGNVHRLAGLDALAQEIAERCGDRSPDLRIAAFSHDAAQGMGVNVWAVGPGGRDWIGTAAGRGVTVAALAALLAPQARAAA